MGSFQMVWIAGILVVVIFTTYCAAFARPSNHCTSQSFCDRHLSGGIMRNRWGPSMPKSSSTSTSSSSSLEVANAENVKTSEILADILSLESIRSALIRQEETIIFALIERAQFRQNLVVYERGGMGPLGIPPGSRPPPASYTKGSSDILSFLEYMLIGTEAFQSGVRRYLSPEEHAFFPDRLPEGIMDVLEELEYPKDMLSDIGGAAEENFNPILLRKYIDTIVPAMYVAGDDEQYGSSVLCDIAILQALSRRVHYGKFVAESKYRDNPEGYQALVDAGDADGVMELLTNKAVEEQVCRRARLKAATYGSEPLLAELPPIPTSSKSSRDETTTIVAAAAASAVVAAIEAMGDHEGSDYKNKVAPSTVESIYRDIIIPLTKDIEVAYLFRRCGRDPPPEYAPDRMSRDCIQ